jgi:hypothetical protein
MTQGEMAAMFKINAVFFASAMQIFLLCGCAHLENKPKQNHLPENVKKIELRNNAGSLLYDLLGKEKNITKILLIKRNGDDVAAFIKAIAATADESVERLERLLKIDPTLNLQAIELPAGEKAARDATEKTNEHDILLSSGIEFELNLLVTQAEALSYGQHLAKVAAENSPIPGEAEQFHIINVALEGLYKQNLKLLRALPK